MAEDTPLVTFSIRRSAWEIWRVYVRASFVRLRYVGFCALIAAGSFLLFITGHPLGYALGSVAVAFCVVVPLVASVNLYRSLSGNPAVFAETDRRQLGFLLRDN